MQGWSKNQPEDRKAAEAALRIKLPRWEGGEDFDQKIDEAFDELNRPQNQHRNWVIINNCKSETEKLLTRARQR